MDNKVFVTERWLDNVLPTMWELAARIVCMICVPVAVSQTALWWLGISQKPRFTVAVVLKAWAGVTIGAVAWVVLHRRRNAILKRNLPKQHSTKCL